MLLAIVVVCSVVVTGIQAKLPTLEQLLLLWGGWLLVLLVALIGGFFMGSKFTGLRGGATAGILGRRCLCYGLVCLATVSWCSFWGVTALEQRLPYELEGRDLLLEGRVEGIPVRFDFGGGGLRFEFVVDHWFSDDGSKLDRQILPARVRLNWYGRDELSSGGSRRLLVRLKRPHGYQNPGGFDYERWLLQRGVGAVGYVRESLDLVARGVDDHAKPFLAPDKPVFSLSAFRQEIYQWVLGRPEAHVSAKQVAAALLVGERAGLSGADRELLQRLGLSHLLAISGLHIGLAAAFGTLLGKLIGRLLNLCMPTRVFAPGVALLCGWCLAVGYGLLAGLTLPTQRALVMLSVWMLFWFAGLRYSPWLPWWLSLALVMLIQPLSFFEVGLWLSFSAVAILILAFQGTYVQGAHVQGSYGKAPNRGAKSAIKGYLLGLLRAQWYLFAGMLVAQAILGMNGSLLAPAANLLAIPYIAGLVVPCLLLVAVVWCIKAAFTRAFEGSSAFFETLADPLLGVLADAAIWMLELFWLFVHRLNEWVSQSVGWAAWVLEGGQYRPPLLVIAALLGLLLWLLPVPRMTRWLGLIICVPLFFPSAGDLHRRLQLVVLDVGQGLAVVVRHGGRVLLIDTGRAFHFDSVLAPYFRYEGIAQLDHLVVSHGDADHAGARARLVDGGWVNEWSVGSWWQKSSDRARSGRDSAGRCDKDGQRAYGELQVSFIGPLDQRFRDGVSSNDGSCVVLLEFGEVRVLLPGDIELDRERDLLKHPAVAGPVDVLVAPHHGSKTSSHGEFVSRLRPKWLVVSAGYRNAYGHPASEVMARYRSQGSRIRETTKAGAVVFDIEASGHISAVGYRQLRRRYWL